MGCTGTHTDSKTAAVCSPPAHTDQPRWRGMRAEPRLRLCLWEPLGSVRWFPSRRLPWARLWAHSPSSGSSQAALRFYSLMLGGCIQKSSRQGQEGSEAQPGELPGSRATSGAQVCPAGKPVLWGTTH